MNQSYHREPRRIAQLLILGSYTMLVLALAAETLLMGWELWALPLILGGVAASWLVHIRQSMAGRQRLWIYTVFMMGTFFFYGIHPTSTYDMGLLMMLVMIIYTVAGESALVTFCQATYYVTLAYDLLVMVRSGTAWDSLLISRTALHIVLIFMGGWLSRFIIRQWAHMFQESDAQIARLDRTARRMNAFMANLSHELRTPVNAILGMAEVMLERERDAQARDSLLIIRDAGMRMASQVSDIMDYSELTTDKLTVNAAPYTLSSLFNDLAAELKPQMPENIELIIDVDADTPARLVCDVLKLKRILFHVIGNSLKYTREGGVYVHVSAVRHSYGVNLRIEVRDTGIGMSEAELEQVSRRFYQADSGKAVRSGGLGLGLPIAYGFVRALGGFIMIDSTPGEGTSVRISIPQQVSDEQRCMSVADRDAVSLGGYLNIGKFAHPHVREFYNRMILNVVQGLGTPMHRVDSAEDLRRLVGKVRLTHLFVGAEEYLSAPDYLESLAAQTSVIVVAHDGFRLPAGSRLSLMPKPLYGFPIASVLNAAHRAGEDPGRMVCPDVRALVVDDEPMNLSVAAGILRKYDMLVATAASGAQALQMCENAEYDIVFMDHMMPEMDGVEVMKRLRHMAERTRRDFPIVALTANALSSAREMFMAEGFDGFISKPIEIPELERVLKRVLPKSAIAYVAGERREPTPPAEAPDSPVVRLARLGFNVADGLRYCQGDEVFYLSMLRQFAGDFEDKQARLAQAYRDRRFNDYAIVVHALKGTAKTVGADALSELARELEAAAKRGKSAVIDARHDALISQYADAAAAIRESCPGEDAPDDAPDALSFEPSGPEDALTFLPEGE